MLRKIIRGLLVVLALIAVVLGVQVFRNSGTQTLAARTDDTLRVASYNVHYIVTFKDTGAWSIADWERRKTPLDLAFKEISADVIVFQEMESFAGRSANQTNLVLEWLLLNNPDYAAAAVGDVRKFPSTQPILYRSDRLEALDQGWFFFSDTPDVIYSPTFNGSYPAYATWAVFRDLQSNETFRIVNVHTDFGSSSNRLKTAELVAERVTAWAEAGETVVVAGDLNARSGDRTHSILAEAGIDFAPFRGATYHLNRGLNLFGAIDHIGVIGTLHRVGEPVVLRQKFNGEWPTDHYPVVVDYTWEAP